MVYHRLRAHRIHCCHWLLNLHANVRFKCLIDRFCHTLHSHRLMEISCTYCTGSYNISDSSPTVLFSLLKMKVNFSAIFITLFINKDWNIHEEYYVLLLYYFSLVGLDNSIVILLKRIISLLCEE